MSKGLIFITGATGFIGSAIALEALKTGYRLRISVRKQSQILAIESLLSAYKDEIEFVAIPDITQESSFAGKLDGADYVLHVASPLVQGVDRETYFGPAVKGTTAVLSEAEKVESVKKVVITSSIAALVPLGGLPEGGVIHENNNWDFIVDTEGSFTEENDFATGMKLYHASKILANNATWDFHKCAKPHYSLVSIHPGLRTNGLFYGSIVGGKPLTTITAVHISNVAEAHVRALDEGIKDGSKYLVSGKPATWGEAGAIVQEVYAVKGFKIQADAAGTSWPVDTSLAERDLGLKWRSLEEIVTGVVDQQLGVAKA
ncbi:3-beta hydroxysteroid dehydrogenase/isomerase family protein [Aspergillus crustosus]